MSQPACTDSALEHVTDCIAEVFGTQPAHIAPETPLTALGLESFAAVRLRRRIRERTGHDLPLTAFLGSAAAKDLAARLSERAGAELLTAIRLRYRLRRRSRLPSPSP